MTRVTRMQDCPRCGHTVLAPAERCDRCGRRIRWDRDVDPYTGADVPAMREPLPPKPEGVA